jgi:hypothetical protein
MPTLVGFGTFAALREERSTKRSAAAFSPVIKGDQPATCGSGFLLGSSWS